MQTRPIHGEAFLMAKNLRIATCAMLLAAIASCSGADGRGAMIEAASAPPRKCDPAEAGSELFEANTGAPNPAIANCSYADLLLQETKSPAVAKAINLWFAMELADRGYGVTNDTVATAVIKDWQRHNGFEPTGVVTVLQMQHTSISKDKEPEFDLIFNSGETENETPSVSRFGNYVFIRGSWWMDDEEIAWPLNESIYQCSLSAQECTHTELILAPGPAEFNVMLDTNTLNIASFDGTLLRINMPSATCRSFEITANLELKQVFQIQTDTGACAGLVDPMKAPRVVRLRSPSFQSAALRQEREQKWLEALSPEARALMISARNATN